MSLKAVLLFLQLFVAQSLCDDVNFRLDCAIENNFNINEGSCKERGCIWDTVSRAPGTPGCYIDPEQAGYKLSGEVQKHASGLDADLKLKESSKKLLTYGPQIEDLKLSVSYITDRIVRFKIFDPKNARYEVPIGFDMIEKGTKETDESKRKYSVNVLNDPKVGFQLVVERKDTKSKMFDTSTAPLIFSDQFLEIATKLPSKNIYGMGENTHKSFRHDLSYKTWPVFARDKGPGDHDLNLMGTHPFYHVIEADGTAFGTLMLNSNAMDYTLMPEPGIALKPAGGIFDFFIFVGDNPEDVIQLYTSLIGRSFMPPFWSLGFQLTRYGYQSDNEVRTVLARQRKQNIPIDVVYVDIDYMHVYRDFTYDKDGNFKNLPALMEETKKDNIHWTLILDPAIEAVEGYDAFTDGYKNEVFLKWPQNVSMNDRHNPSNTPNDKDVAYGKVWPNGPASFPDFFKTRTEEWWVRQHEALHKLLPFDAIWIDMNEPASFVANCPQNPYDFHPIRMRTLWGGRQLSAQTACMVLRQGEHDQYMHYDVHNLYGYSQIIATQKAVQKATGKRGYVLSRSTYVGSGQFGAHWLGDNNSQWSNLGHSLIGILEFNLFGINFVGADICGFIGNTNPDLCRQWSRTGAFYPFSRNHNNKGQMDQDPAIWAEKGNPEVTESARNALRMRYRLLPFLYTLFFHAHTKGSTVARPFVHEWPKDENTANIWEQFLWGRSLMISPLIHENQHEVNVYFPPDEHWFDLNDGLQLETKSGKVTLQDKHPNGPPPLHLRGGSIITMVSADNLTTTSSPAFNTLNLVVAPSKAKTATGDLFWDDKESIDTIEGGKYNLYEFTLNSDCSIDIKAAKSGYTEHPQIDSVIIAGTQGSGGVTGSADGKSISGSIANGVTTIKINMKLDKDAKIDWKQGGKCNLA